jgi:hypothetical protein
MNQLPPCPGCGERGWQRNVFIRYNEPEHIWTVSEGGHTAVNRPDDPGALEVIDKTIWECEFCGHAADGPTALKIEDEFEAYETAEQRNNLDEWRQNA